MKKHIVVLLITFCSILFVHPAYAANGVMPGNGTENSPFLIEDIDDFKKFYSNVNFWAEGVYVQLVCDLDLSGVGTYSQALIGSCTDRYGNLVGTVFEGVFNGNHHVISNLNVSGKDYCGLFGRINANAVIRNVSLNSCSITGTKKWIGGLVGYNNGGIISHCSVTGSVSGANDISDCVGGLVGFNKGSDSSISNCNATVTVKSFGANVGGLVGEIYSGSISNCYASGTVTGLDNESNKIGGLVGYNFSGTVSDCFADATVKSIGNGVGGLIGSKNDNSAVCNCHATCSVTGNKNVGGLVGYNIGKVAFSFFTGTVTGSVDNVGGLIGFNEAGRIGNCSASATVNGDGDNVGGLVGLNNDNNILYCNASGAVEGNDYVGGLVGYDSGNISYCNADCSVNGTGSVGGLVGFEKSGSVSYCYAAGTVEGSGSIFGGLVGCNEYGSISDCNATVSVDCDGDAAGGLVGFNVSGSISNCYSAGVVDGSDYIGGLCGYQGGSDAIIKQCFWDTETSGLTVGYNLHAEYPGSITNVKGLSTSQMLNRNNFINAGWDFTNETANGINNIWVMDSYPVLCWQLSNIAASGNGSIYKPYIINSIYDFYVFCSDTNYWEQGVNTKMNCDLDLSAAGTFIQALIAGDTDTDLSFDGALFAGNFNGNNHVISNLTVSGSYFCGLFGKTYSSAVISNLGLENVSITGLNKYVGGLVGFNYGGSLGNCYVTGSVLAYNEQTGGITGRNEGSIRYCYSSAAVTGYDEIVGGLTGSNTGSIRNSYFTGSATGSNYVGGLTGTNFGNVTDCYSTGLVTGIGVYVCGLCGYQGADSSLVNCIWNTETSGVTDGYVNDSGSIAVNILSKTTTEMQTQSTFADAGWDFNAESDNGTEELWHMPYQSSGYPMLFFQRDIPGDITDSYGVDMQDFNKLAQGWQDQYTITDLSELAEYWLEGK